MKKVPLYKVLFCLLLFFFCGPFNLVPQSTSKKTVKEKSYLIYRGKKINHTDADGKSQGHWKFFTRFINKKDKKDSAVTEEGSFTDGLKTGNWKTYFISGKLKGEAEFVDGFKDGLFFENYENGKLKKKGKIDVAMPVEFYKEYDSTGLLVKDFLYTKDGKRDGLQKTFFAGTGIISLIEFMNKGNEDSTRHFTSDGKLYRTTKWNMPLKEALARNLNYTDSLGKKQGYWIVFGKNKLNRAYADTSKAEEGVFKDNRKEEMWKEYYPSGKLKSEIEYKNGRPNGHAKMYDETGSLKEEGTWQNSRWTGPYILYQGKDCPFQKTTFESNGKRTGESIAYFPGCDTLHIQKICWYKNGREDSCREFDKQGNLLKRMDNKDKKYDLKPIQGERKDGGFYPRKKINTDTILPNNLKGAFFIGSGFERLYSDCKKIAREGFFSQNRLMTGRAWIYDKNCVLKRIAIYKEGRYVGDTDVIERSGKELQYDSLLYTACKNISAKKYAEAKNCYKAVLKINPADQYAKIKMKQCEVQINLAKNDVAKNEKKYNYWIALADGTLAEKKYEKAKEYYLEALMLHPEKIYPVEKLKECCEALQKLPAKGRAADLSGRFENGKLVDGKMYVYDKNGLLWKVVVFKDGKYLGEAQLE